MFAWPWLTSSPPRVVRLSGSHHEIGVQHGRLLRNEIRALYDAYVVAGIVEKEGRPLHQLVAAARHYDAFVPARYREEMRGIAEGSGMTYEQILVINTFADALLGESRFCSAVAVNGRDGLLVGRNLDWMNHRVAHRSGVVFILEPSGARRVISVGWPGMTGVVTGMNDAGLAVSMNMAFANDLEPRAMPALIRIREMLERDATPRAAAARAIATPRTIAMNLMLADEREAVVLELSGQKHAFVPMTNGCAVTTNHYQSLRFGGGFGGDRTAKLRAAFADENRVSSGAVKRALLRVAMLGPSDGLATIHSVVFHPRSRELEVAAGKLPAPLGRFHRVSF